MVMIATIACNQSRSRLFPISSPDLYRLSPDPQSDGPQTIGRNVLRLVERPRGLWARLTGCVLDPLGRVGRMLLLHSLAFEAERSGCRIRADFFWRESHYALRRTW